ncbi:1-deoxy-D-xylulose-5-phosphate reductoisomerase [Streptomyces violaceorubidus]
MSDSPAPLADPHLVYDPVAGDGPKDVVILGSTGSIGTQAIDLVLRNPDRFRVTALSANGGRVALLAEQAYRLKARTVAVAREDAVPALREALSDRYGAGEPLPEILAGPTRPPGSPPPTATRCSTASPAPSDSRPPSPPWRRAAPWRWRQVAAHRRRPAGQGAGRAGQIIPVDSEHAALFQALAAGTRADVKLVVTASGGPFRRAG